MTSRKPLFSVHISDCRVDTFTVGGNGGGGKDTSNTGVRITHEPSGAVGRAVDARSQFKNKQLALKRLASTPEFRSWVKLRAAGFESIDSWVEDQMKEANLKVEFYDPKA
jgi:protein subunit release factor B